MRSLLLLGCLIITHSISGQVDWHNSLLKGKVKSVYEKQYEVKDSANTWMPLLVSPQGIHTKAYYNIQGNMSRFEIFDHNGNLKEGTLHVYENGVYHERNFYNAEGEITKEGVVSFISDSVYVIDSYNKGGDLVMIDTTYLKNRDFVKVINQTMSGASVKDVCTIFFVYGKQRSLISVYTMQNDDIGFNQTYQYRKFDQKSNWIERLIFSGDKEKPKFISVRAIEYY